MTDKRKTEPERARTLADLDPYDWAYEKASPEHILRRMGELLQPLLDKHKIPPNLPDKWKWMLLAFELAMKSGAFKRRRRQGAPQKWDRDAKISLLYNVEDRCRNTIAKEKGCPVEVVTVRDAIRRLIREDPTKWGTNVHSLENRYNEAQQWFLEEAVVRYTRRHGLPDN
jgi:hypothetical protein